MPNLQRLSKFFYFPFYKLRNLFSGGDFLRYPQSISKIFVVKFTSEQKTIKFYKNMPKKEEKLGKNIEKMKNFDISVKKF